MLSAATITRHLRTVDDRVHKCRWQEITAAAFSELPICGELIRLRSIPVSYIYIQPVAKYEMGELIMRTPLSALLELMLLELMRVSKACARLYLVGSDVCLARTIHVSSYIRKYELI